MPGILEEQRTRRHQRQSIVPKHPDDRADGDDEPDEVPRWHDDPVVPPERRQLDATHRLRRRDGDVRPQQAPLAHAPDVRADRADLARVQPAHHDGVRAAEVDAEQGGRPDARRGVDDLVRRVADRHLDVQ